MMFFDAHLHIIDPRFPLVENQGYRPPAYSIESYLNDIDEYGAVGGALVAGSYQGFDQEFMKATLRELGEGYVGVAQIPSNITFQSLSELHDAGVRAIRFNMKRRGDSLETQDVEALAQRVHERFGWHSEFYVDAASLRRVKPLLKRLPVVVVDHLGLDESAERDVLEVVEHGAFVKATGFGRLNFDVAARLRAIASINPGAIMFGTDLPGTRAPRAFDHADISLLIDALGETNARRALQENAVSLYLRREP